MIEFTPILLAATWESSMMTWEIIAGMVILVIALVGIAYKFLTGEWNWDDFNKGD